MRFEFHSGLQCWTLRRYADVQAALRDSSQFAASLAPGFDEAGHTRTLRLAMDAFLQIRFPRWMDALENTPELPRPITDLVSQWIEPWSHLAALQLVGLTLSHDREGRLLQLARKAFAAGALPQAPATSETSQDTEELQYRLPGVLGPLTVQAFVATSQTLTAFLANALAALQDQQVEYPHTAKALEELLRLAGPAILQFRYLTKPLQDLAPGTRVALLLREANRDPDLFPAPDRLHFNRTPAAAHLAFGHGAHACVGAALMRAAAPVALRHLTEILRGSKVEAIEWPPENELRAILSPTAIRIHELPTAKLRFED
jgi:hypothetical protein